MRFPIQKLCVGVLFAGLAGWAVLAADPARTDIPPVKGMALPEYDPAGKLLRPTGYEKWVVVGTSIGLGYSEDAKPDPDNPGLFHNVYLQPEAFDQFVETGTFPEQTVFIVTNNRSQPARTKGPVSRIGFVAAPTSGLEVAVKDSKRSPEGWAYYMFRGPPDKSATSRSAEAAFAAKDCYDCHASHGQTDSVFTQFYSVLTDARERRLAEHAAAK